MASRPTVVALFLCVTLSVALNYAWADGYKEELIAKYPFYNIATGSFAPVYPALAQQIVQDFDIKDGLCVDVGGGCGSLSMALARITNLTIYMLDIDPTPVRLCNLLVDEAGLTGRVRAIEGDAQDMPFRDNFANLVVSRGSIFFWPDQLRGVLECYRILKPGGVAYIGGGFSRILDPAVRDPLAKQAAKQHRSGGGGGWRPIAEDIVEKAKAAGIADIQFEREQYAGQWLTIRK